MGEAVGVVLVENRLKNVLLLLAMDGDGLGGE
jgi:hypothetical protein